eukprot:115806_1
MGNTGGNPFHTPSSAISSPDPFYWVCCSKHFPPECVYAGPSRSEYDYYNSDPSRGCKECAAEENQRQKRLAEQKAWKAKCEEEERIRLLKEKLEREERAKELEAQRKREEERQNEKEEMERVIYEQQQKRIAENKKILEESNEIIKQETEKLKSRKTTHPITAFKRCDTVKVIKELGNKALEYGVAGHIISERVNQIKNELQSALTDDYKLIESEVERYEKYGEEMKDITTEFIDIFGAVFDKIRHKKAQFDEDAKEYDEAESDDEKEIYKQDIKNGIEELAAGINKMKFKLLLMEQYYIRMKEDYQKLVDFIDKTSNELHTDKVTMNHFLTNVAADIKNKKQRDVFDGQKDKEYEQKHYVEEKYDVINYSSKEGKVLLTKQYVSTETETGGGCGRAIGAIAGAAVGTLAGGPVFGGIGNLAGGLLGAAIGSLLAKGKSKKKVKWKVIETWEFKGMTSVQKNAGTVQLDITKDSYDGIQQATALEEIRNAMGASINKFINDLAAKNQSVKQQLRKFGYLQNANKELIQYVDEFKNKVDTLQEILNGGNEIKESHRKNLNKKWNETSALILAQLKSMKSTNN